MANIVQKIWKNLDNSPCIRRNMSQGLINSRALAKYMIKEKKVEASLGAAISAIRRYQLNKHDEVFATAHKILHKTINISMRSSLAEIYLIKDDEIQQTLPKIFGIIHYVQGDVLRIIQANKSIRLLVDEENLQELISLFPKHKILDIDKNLAEINLHIHPEMQNTRGILAVIASELAINGINIVEAMTCPPEMLFFVREEDLVNAYNILYQQCKPTKKE